MSWNESEDCRFVLDSGAWNFRLRKLGEPSADDTYTAISRIGIEKKSNRNFVTQASDQFINESENRFSNTHTKGILTNYLAYNELLDSGLAHFGILNEKRGLKPYSLTLQIRPFQPKRASCNQLEYFFELEGFNALLPLRPGEKIFNKDNTYSGLLVDIGHSHSYIIPVFNDCVIMQSVKRLEIGGKLLSKCFSEVISTTQVNLKNYFFTANNIKEQLGLVSACGNVKSMLINQPIDEFTKTFVLPDYEISTKGYVSNATSKPEKDHVVLKNERFVIPEALFSPSM